jgi:hypothetical protein
MMFLFEKREAFPTGRRCAARVAAGLPQAMVYRPAVGTGIGHHGGSRRKQHPTRQSG